MKLRLLLLIAILLGSYQSATAAPIQQAPQPPFRQSSLLPVAEQIGQQIQALVGPPAEAEGEPEETFGTRALSFVLNIVNIVRAEISNFATNINALPQISSWLDLQISEPNLYARWITIGQQLVLVVGGALVVAWAIDLGLLPFRRRIAKRTPATQGGRVNAMLGWLFVKLVTLVVFVTTAVELLGQSDQSKLTRYVVMTVVYAIAVQSLVRVATSFALAPRAPSLRLVPLSTPQASYIQSWVRWYGFVMVFGYFFIDLAHLVKVPQASITAFSSLLGLTIVVMSITIISSKRAAISNLIRGNLSAAQPELTLLDSLRLWLARSWQMWAISYLVIGYLVTTISSDGGFSIMLRGTILTLLILVSAQLAFYFISKSFVTTKSSSATSLYRPVFKILLKITVWLIACAGIIAAWGVDISALLSVDPGKHIVGSAFLIASTIVLLVLFYELAHNIIQRQLNRYDSNGKLLEITPRARTLLPLLRNAAIMILAVITGLVTLSVFNINIATLLAGAGIIGVAVGFGAQTLVKDFFTGLFIVLEDTIAVGDVIKLDNHSGVVENITIRTVRLRDLDGAVHSIPFSQISKIVNMTKGFAYAVVDLSVAYDSELRQVMSLMRSIGEEMQNDPTISSYILEPLEMLGVEKFADSAIVIRCRFKTRPGKQWEIKRAFLLCIKERFDKEGIEIPYPTSVQYMRVNKESDLDMPNPSKHAQ